MPVEHYENFPVASILLPRRLRGPVALIYRFAREADDFADEGDAPAHVRLQQLERFRAELRRLNAGLAPGIPWFSDLGHVIREHNLPVSAFEDLLSAFAQDVVQSRYASYEQVLDYCRRSANPVGRLLLALYGESAREPLAWSDAICSSLQLINFLQDVAIDYRKGRIYMPLDEMLRAGITEQQIAKAETGPAWREFMDFQIGRARSLLYFGAPLGRTLKGRIGLEMRMIIAGGARILEKIESVGGDVFRHRPILGPLDWPLMLVRAMTRSSVIRDPLIRDS
ncbi:MAG: Squalene synthase HpnC [Betaproteobacteria bacterium]|jgi:squalene synthase HpnC|nr:Squalene synthase HpnC [Betaproteobacteria bacterium]